MHNVLAVVLASPARKAGLVGTGPFNLGQPDDFRVPDQGYHRGLPGEVWVPTAAIVIEVLSPDDETWAKFDFYARRGVEEIGVADPLNADLRWLVLSGPTYRETRESGLLDLSVDELSGRIDWPR